MRTIQAAEGKRRHEQARLDLAMGTELRDRLGQFSTPSPLADDIVRYCWEHWKRQRCPVRFLEPCVGTGSFFSSLRRIFPTDLIEHAYGCEVDTGYADVARALWNEAGLQVKHADFLKEIPPTTKYNLLITNPPSR
jgi:hypothetical protein